ncbi:MinD/ParA family protein [Microbacterium testaceum]|uniref:MinD/ParA family ATP-binding protein n=1 Tax=Microbacterium testaceum TaxID=2033 RepID=UPI001CDA2D00|nr:MinD/ParA family protein [Microbacterium testaceum]
MTPDRTDANPDENADHGVLDEIGNLDTASITILGGHIAQVNVDLPATNDDDDLDDDVIEDEIPLDEADLAALDAPRMPTAADDHPHDHDRDDIVHDPHVEQLPTGDIILEPHDGAEVAESIADADVHDAEIVDDATRGSTDEIPDAEHPAAEEHSGDDVLDAEPSADGVEADATDLDADPDAAPAVSTDADGDVDADTDDAGAHDDDRDVEADQWADAAEAPAEGLPGDPKGATPTHDEEDEPSDDDELSDDDARADSDPVDADSEESDAVEQGPAESDAWADDLADAEIVDDVELLEADAAEPVDAFDSASLGTEAAELDHAPAGAAEAHDGNHAAEDAAEPLTHAPWVPAADDDRFEHAAALATSSPRDEPIGDPASEGQPSSGQPIADEARSHESSIDAASEDEGDTAEAATTDTAETTTSRAPEATAPETTAPAPAPEPVAPAVPSTRAERAATGVIGTIPLTRRSAQQADEAARAADEAARVDRAHALERVRTPAPEIALTSKRIGEIDDARESSDLLTADRLLDPRQIARPEPEGLWQQLVYSVSRHRINLGDGRRARQRKDLDRRIAAPLSGGARFVPVLSRKGGVGKTTVTSLLGMALADARDDRIIAVDANPDRGTLADRVGRPNGRTVRDLVRSHDEMAGYNDVSSIVARDATRLDVLASDSDPRVSEAFSDDDYRQVADVAAHYYSIVLTDTGTGIVHSVMGATLELADTLVIVAGLSVDEARLASETLTWLETNGYAARVRDAVVVLNNSRPGAPLVRESELEAHFRSRVRTVIRMPYDARIAAGSAITFRDLQPSTRQAARELAAAVVEGLRTPAAAA